MTKEEEQRLAEIDAQIAEKVQGRDRLRNLRYGPERIDWEGNYSRHDGLIEPIKRCIKRTVVSGDVGYVISDPHEDVYLPQEAFAAIIAAYAPAFGWIRKDERDKPRERD